MNNEIALKAKNKAFKIVPIDFLAKVESDEIERLNEENEELKKEIDKLNKIIFDLKNFKVSLEIVEFSDNQFSSEDEEDNKEDEYYEIIENDVPYYTDGFDVYKVDEDGEVGEIVGTYEDGSVIFL